MNDPRHDQEHPEQEPPDLEHLDLEETWLQERYPAASADFVEQTLARVIADQAEIAYEEQRVDEFRFDPAFLALLEVPPVASDFVDNTLQRVLAQQRQRASGDRALENLMHRYQVPPVSEDFVRRTLSALDTGDQRPAAFRRRAYAWAAAILLLAGTLLLVPRSIDRESPTGRPTAAYTPVRFGTVMATTAKLRAERDGDPLVTLAYLGSQSPK